MDDGITQKCIYLQNGPQRANLSKNEPKPGRKFWLIKKRARVGPGSRAGPGINLNESGPEIWARCHL